MTAEPMPILRRTLRALQLGQTRSGLDMIDWNFSYSLLQASQMYS